MCKRERRGQNDDWPDGLARVESPAEEGQQPVAVGAVALGKDQERSGSGRPSQDLRSQLRSQLHSPLVPKEKHRGLREAQTTFWGPKKSWNTFKM